MKQIRYAFVAVWVLKTISEPVSNVKFGLLTTIEMITAWYYASLSLTWRTAAPRSL